MPLYPPYLDATASDIQPVGSAAAAGAIGKGADAGHVHVGLLPSNNLSDVGSKATAFANLAPTTTEGDLIYENATPAPARLPIGAVNTSLQSNGSLPSWQLALVQQATTGYTGYTLVNGTGTIISWTAPNDGSLHRFVIFARLIVSSSLTGGAIFAGNAGTILTGGTVNSGAFLWNNNQGAGDYFLTKSTLATDGILGPAEQIYVKQTVAVTGGAGIVYAEIWAS